MTSNVYQSLQANTDFHCRKKFAHSLTGSIQTTWKKKVFSWLVSYTWHIKKLTMVGRQGQKVHLHTQLVR